MNRFKYLSLVLLLSSQAFAENYVLLGRGWKNASTGAWMVAICEAQVEYGCSKFSFRKGAPMDNPSDPKSLISESFSLIPNGSWGPNGDQNEYLKLLFKALYESETRDELTIVFNFKTQGFDHISKSSFNQNGWNWADQPTVLNDSDFTALSNRIAGKGEFWFKAKDRCRTVNKLKKLGVAIPTVLTDFFEKNCVEKAETDDSFQRNLNRDNF